MAREKRNASRRAFSCREKREIGVVKNFIKNLKEGLT